MVKHTISIYLPSSCSSASSNWTSFPRPAASSRSSSSFAVFICGRKAVIRERMSLFFSTRCIRGFCLGWRDGMAFFSSWFCGFCSCSCSSSSSSSDEESTDEESDEEGSVDVSSSSSSSLLLPCPTDCVLSLLVWVREGGKDSSGDSWGSSWFRGRFVQAPGIFFLSFSFLFY